MLALCCSIMPIAAPRAHGQVIEIGDDGVVRQRSNTAAVGWTTLPAPGARPAPRAGHGASALPAASVLPAATSLPAGSVEAAGVPEIWRAPFAAAASRYNVSPHLLSALIWQESRWHPQAISPKGAVGLGQLMPATARALAVDPRDPEANIDGAARYLRLMLDTFDGDVVRALAAYNAGAARVARAGGVPAIAETRSYVANILNRVTATTTTGLLK